MQRAPCRCCPQIDTISGSSAFRGLSTILVLLVALLLVDETRSSPLLSDGNKNMIYSKQCISRPSLVHKISTSTRVAWIAGPTCHEKIRTRSSSSNIIHTRLIHSQCRHSSTLSAQNSAFKEPMQMKQPSKSLPSNDTANDTNSLENTLEDAHHWFIETLPEGWCVGVCTSSAVDSICLSDEEKSILNSTTLLHPDEYQWGKINIASDTSRTSYYLGRMALPLSLKTLLESESCASTSLYAQLQDQIQTTAIKKDYYGRPILPEIIAGSISHKGEYAVGLARFRSSTGNGANVFRGLNNEKLEPLDASAVQWREECPIDFDENENIDVDNENGTPFLSKATTARGVGIDLERIDASRGKRIKRKVLTENEQKDLGRLEVSAHLMLRLLSAREICLSCNDSHSCRT